MIALASLVVEKDKIYKKKQQVMIKNVFKQIMFKNHQKMNKNNK